MEKIEGIIKSSKPNMDGERCDICFKSLTDRCGLCASPSVDCQPALGACNHFFHRHCIKKWLSFQGGNHTKCPRCRQAWAYRMVPLKDRDLAACKRM